MFKRRLIILFILLLACAIVIFSRLLHIQVYAHQEYLARLEDIMLRPPVLLPAVRGQIFDRRGRLLADNAPCFSIAIHYGALSLDEQYLLKVARNRARRDLGRRPRKSEIQSYIQLVEAQIRDMWLQLPALVSGPGQDPAEQARLLNDRLQETITTVQRWRAKSETRLKHREQQILAQEANWLQEAQLRAIRRQIASLVLREEESFIPMIFGLENDTARRIQVRLDSPEWLTVIPAADRVYPYGYVASQTIGSVGSVLSDDPLYQAHPLEDPATDDPYRGYAVTDDIIGHQGVERGYDWEVLRGSRGLQQKDRLGNLVPGGNLEPQKGEDLHLTLDIELQKDCELAMPTEAPGAAVIIDVATGGVLALVSTPLHPRGDSIPPLTVPGERSWMNRAVEVAYSPGSTVKPAVILAGLSQLDHRADSGRPINSEQTPCSSPSSEFAQPSCGSHSHGYLGPRDAIKRSCNVFCAFVAEMLNLDMLMWFADIGLTQPTALRLPREHPGTLARLTSSRFGVARKMPAFELRQMAIGQGQISVTTLQVANMMATLARRGVYVLPTINLKETPGAHSLDLQCNPRHIKLVIDAMEAVVHEPGGTAHGVSSLHNLGFQIAGKTGTAEFGEEDTWHCWFAGFAPVDQPRLAFAVIIEQGDSGAKVAGPVAAHLLELCVKHGYIQTSDTEESSLQAASSASDLNDPGDVHEPF